MKERQREGGGDQINDRVGKISTPARARDKIGAGAAHKKGRPKPPPQFQLTVWSPPPNQQLAREGHYILPIFRCPLLADADVSIRPLR
jgi:hypothetical protein